MITIRVWMPAANVDVGPVQDRVVHVADNATPIQEVLDLVAPLARCSEVAEILVTRDGDSGMAETLLSLSLNGAAVRSFRRRIQ